MITLKVKEMSWLGANILFARCYRVQAYCELFGMFTVLLASAFLCHAGGDIRYMTVTAMLMVIVRHPCRAYLRYR